MLALFKRAGSRPRDATRLGEASSSSSHDERQSLLATTATMGSSPEPAQSSPAPPAEDVERHQPDAAMAKRVLWKIDRTIIPLLFITYMFNFMDKTILSSASVFGLRKDTVSCDRHRLSLFKAC